MRVKKFEAKNMKDALQMVKNELGPDAVILHAKDNRKSYGLGGEASVEITAAVSEQTLQKKKFVESRMTAADRTRFQNSNARDQRQIISHMVEARVKTQETARAVPRQITQTSYIDIPDDTPATPRRKAALDRASGRNVAELLRDFDQDFSSDHDDDADQWSEKPARAVAQVAAKEPSDQRALARIRNAAREALRANPFMEEERPVRAKPKAQPSRTASQAYAEDRAQAPQDPRAGQRGPIAPVAARRLEEQMQPANTPPNPQANARAQAGAVRVATESANAMRVTNPGFAPASATASNRTSGGLEMHGESELHAQQEARAEVHAQAQVEVKELKTEIDRLQKMLRGFQHVPQSFVTMHPGAEYGIPYDLSFMFQKLTESGVNIDGTNEILQAAMKAIDPVQIKKRPIVDAWVARWFLTHVNVNPTPFQGRVHLFVGPAGSGKTSTLVKMASHLVVKEKKKVAILSTDAFKVGAVDQLKIYCQILNVPFAVIRSRKDWEWVLSQLPHVDHVLVDFPGFQLGDIEEIHTLKALLPPQEVAPVTHFCVSATSRDGDALEMARRYRALDYQDLIFTNLDQSVQHGIIYSLQKKTGKPLHSFGLGNRIPEDFEAASKERVLDLIFKLTKLNRETK